MNQFPSTVRFRGKGVYGLLIIVLVASLLGHAATIVTAAPVAWYVDNQASGTNNGTSWANAWRSLSSINWSVVNPGDTVYISGGTSSKTYNEGIEYSRSGSSGAPITITNGAQSPSPAGHNGEVIISGTTYCIRTDGNYNTIRNLTCQNASSSGFYIRGTGSIVENTVVRNISGQGIHIHFCTSCTARGNRITTADDVAAQTDGITVYDSTDTIVEKNWIKISNQNNCTGCHNDGIQTSTTLGAAYKNITIRYNYVENVKASTNNAQGIYLTQMQGNVKIIGNIVSVPYGGQPVASRLYNNNAPVNVSVINNTIKGAGYWNLRVEDDDPVIMNNIIWQTGGIDGYIKNGSLVRLDGRSSGSAASHIDNNLMYAPYTSGYAFNTAGTATTLATWKANGFDAHGLFQDPNLDNCLRPAGGSAPSINRGAVLDAQYDFGISTAECGTSGPGSFLPVAGSSRSSSAGWDIGAYEYGGVVTAPTATQPAPTATRIAPTATRIAPTATQSAPTATRIAPTATRIAPTATRPAPTATRVPPTATPITSNSTPVVPAGGGFKIFLPVIDVSANQSEPQSNLGQLPDLAVDARPKTVSYMRFDVAGLEGHAIQKATLRIFTNRKNNHPVFASSVTGDETWTETGLTFANAPALGDQIASAMVSSTNAWVSLDVTALVHSEGSVAIALTTSYNSAAQFASKESGANAPQLIVDLL